MIRICFRGGYGELNEGIEWCGADVCRVMRAHGGIHLVVITIKLCLDLIHERLCAKHERSGLTNGERKTCDVD